jgi:hypothetical protein
MKMIVSIVAYIVCVQLFSQAFVPMTTVRRTTAITMGGGRSQGEKVLTKRQIFQEVRGKLNKAAEIPGFFDVGQHVVSPSSTQNNNDYLQHQLLSILNPWSFIRSYRVVGCGIILQK